MEFKDRNESAFFPLVIDKMTIHESPVEGPVSITLRLKAGIQTDTFSVLAQPRKEENVEIPVKLRLRRKDETMVFYFDCQIQDVPKEDVRPQACHLDSDVSPPCKIEEHHGNCCLVTGTELWGVCVWNDREDSAHCYCDCSGPWILCNGGPLHCPLDCTDAGAPD